uniref:Transmembrane protein n=1 Tax=Panagrolaimus davidi TaxID=227884 RepID=A0A914P536_9BILA
MFLQKQLVLFLLLFIFFLITNAKVERNDDGSNLTHTTTSEAPTTLPPTTKSAIITTATNSSLTQTSQSPLPSEATETYNGTLVNTPGPLSDIKSLCLYAYNSCFSQWSAKFFNESSVASFCDYSFYIGNACMNEKIMDIDSNNTFKAPNPSKPIYTFLECTRLLSKDDSSAAVLPIKQLSWNFLSYCISNSPTNSSNPDCFKNIQTSCTNPLSTKCTTSCINYIFDEEPEDYVDPELKSAAASKFIFSIFVLIISSLLF